MVMDMTLNKRILNKQWMMSGKAKPCADRSKNYKFYSSFAFLLVMLYRMIATL